MSSIRQKLGRRASVVLGAASVLLLAACGGPTEGYVTGKRHEDARTYMSIVPIYAGQNCFGSGTSRTCTPRYIYVPMKQYDDEDWILDLSGENGKNKGQAFVIPDVWNRLKIGDYWNAKSDGGGPKDPTGRVGG